MQPAAETPEDQTKKVVALRKDVLFSEPPVCPTNDYNYFANIFGTANSSQLLSSLKQELRKSKRNFKHEMSLDPDLRADQRQKEIFKQDILVGNNIRHINKKKGKPPVPPARPCDVSRRIVKLQIIPEGIDVPTDRTRHDCGCQTDAVGKYASSKTP